MTPRAAVAMILALALPGAGHAFLGRRARGAAFFLIVSTMFALGLAVDGGLYRLDRTEVSVLRLVAAAASMGSGLLYGAAWLGGVEGNIVSATFEYGKTFTLTAGLMNLLLVLDCYDISSGRRN